ncbi:MAG: UTP--glucose-1-phosphate uridylyltransferase [Deltaproteobacteria bacterium]|jgi:UTP--glucose-1-phosphate uridylyltransferase|nr:UTP--glucose-1-phosphate uridylyltransferase [Deltaproteobacteria bacterium]MBW2669535.1 UTP--glucose-1-phosphate uridylyltransferase [Deltaproteobacteria bacterium]
MPENQATSKHLLSFMSKMESAGLHPFVMDTFAYYYKKIVSGETGRISDRDIRPIASNEVQDATRLEEYAEAGRNALKNAVMIKLNGGLGTSMGLTRAKSLLEVKNGKTFLEIILKQTEKRHVKLALMNSFNTHDDTLDALSKIHPPDRPLLFLQNKFPKVLQENFAPANCPKNPELEWNPPGHGDIYAAIYTSGVLKSLLDKGITYAFISNSDNLGATLDESLLGYFSENRFPFMMEVAPRTPSDVKGGHVARHQDGRLILRESAQCPKNELSAFRDIKRYRFFNTNNIWVNLETLARLLDKQGIITLPLIRNPKTLDPRDEKSPKVYQIETAMGAAVSLFEGATLIQVPLSRFLPVKKCNELLSIRSDRFIFSNENTPVLNSKVRSKIIQIDLEPKYYGKIDLFDERFIHGIPSLMDCESLTIRGDVRFERNVTIKGRVVITNNLKSQMVVKEGTVLDKDVIFN